MPEKIEGVKHLKVIKTKWIGSERDPGIVNV
jgi:hypothetical protein